jgi:pimeloyl-ACP methyl ester carboxylesterase
LKDPNQRARRRVDGAWLSARSWENYADYFGKRGFAVSAPEWPRKHGDVEEMRETAEESAGLGVQEIVDHYEGLIRELEQPPVLIGHSYGGLFVELLLDRGLGRAGVAMSPAPPKGILALPLKTLKSGAPALAHPSKWDGVVLDARAVRLQLRQHLLARGRGRRLRALRRPGDGPDLLRSRLRELPPAPADRGPLQEGGGGRRF